MRQRSISTVVIASPTMVNTSLTLVEEAMKISMELRPFSQRQ